MSIDGKIDKTIYVDQGLVRFIAKAPVGKGWVKFPEGGKLIKPGGRGGVLICGYSGDYCVEKHERIIRVEPNGNRVVGGNAKYWVRPEGANEFRFPDYEPHGYHIIYGNPEYR